MSLKIKCPNCGELDTVPDEAMYKRARCNACKSLFFVKDAIEHTPVQAESQELISTALRRQWRALSDVQRGFILKAGFIVVICILMGAISLFSSSSNPTSQNQITDQSVRRHEDSDAAEGSHRETPAEAARRQQQAYEAAMATQQPQERYYRDSKGVIISETEAESKLAQIRRQIDEMPDNLEKAYYEGMLRVAEEEWDRIKQQGPIK